MELDNKPTAQKLMRSFMQFGRASWQMRAVDKYKPSEIAALLCIKQRAQPGTPGIKVSELSGIMKVTSPSVTQWVNSLAAEGLVERSHDPIDRRAVRIRLTEKGEGVARKAQQSSITALNSLISYLGEEKSRQLAELLEEVVRYYDEQAGKTHPQPNGDDKA